MQPAVAAGPRFLNGYNFRGLRAADGVSCGWTPISERLQSRAFRVQPIMCCGWTPISERLQSVAGNTDDMWCCGWTPISERLQLRLDQVTVNFELRLDPDF